MQGVRAGVNKKMRRRACRIGARGGHAAARPSGMSTAMAVCVSTLIPAAGRGDVRLDRRQQKTRLRGFFRSESWCPGEDSNLHGFTR